MDAQPYCHELFDLPTTPIRRETPLASPPSPFFSPSASTNLVPSKRRSSKKHKTTGNIGDAQAIATSGKKVQPKYRNWVFTINNPPIDVDGKPVPPEPLAWSRHVYSIWQLERGENGTLHWQGYVEFSGQFSLSQLKSSCKELGTAHLEGRRGTAEQAREYCTPCKGGAVRDPTVVSDTPLEFGERKQVICPDCYFFLARQARFYAEAVGLFSLNIDDLLSWHYYIPSDPCGVYKPCQCLLLPGDNGVFPPRMKFIFKKSGIILDIDTVIKF